MSKVEGSNRYSTEWGMFWTVVKWDDVKKKSNKFQQQISSSLKLNWRNFGLFNIQKEHKKHLMGSGIVTILHIKFAYISFVDNQNQVLLVYYLDIYSELLMTKHKYLDLKGKFSPMKGWFWIKGINF